MNDRNKIDDLFREAMTGYQVEPSLGLWRRIERRFFPPSRYSPSGLITSIILIFIAGLMPWVLIPANDRKEKEPNVQPENARRGYMIKPASQEGMAQDSRAKSRTEKTYTIQATYYQQAEAQSAEPAQPDVFNTIRNPVDEPSEYLLANADPDAYMMPAHTYTDEPETLRDDYWYFRMHSHRAGLMDPRYAGLDAPALRGPVITSSFSGNHENDYFKKSELSVGMNFNPSIVFYDPNPYNKMLGGDAMAYYSISNWTIQGGIGYSRMEDVGSYKVNYKSYDSVGFFVDVISFTVDPRNPGDIVYTTREVTIYDSVPHYTISEKTNLYSYLDFPLAVGYSFLNKGRISIAANAGLKFSVLIGREEPTVDYTVSNGEIIDIERQVPARMNTNWRFTAGLDFGYLLTSQFSFHLEPVFEQYVSPVYAKQPGIKPKKPAVTGVKAGFRFTF